MEKVIKTIGWKQMVADFSEFFKAKKFPVTCISDLCHHHV